MPENPIGRDHLIKLVQALTSTKLDEDKKVLLMALLVLAADRIGEPSDMGNVEPATERGMRLVIRQGGPLPSIGQLFQEPEPGPMSGASEVEPGPDTDEVTVTLGIGRKGESGPGFPPP